MKNISICIGLLLFGYKTVAQIYVNDQTWGKPNCLIGQSSTGFEGFDGSSLPSNCFMNPWGQNLSVMNYNNWWDNNSISIDNTIPGDGCLKIECKKYPPNEIKYGTDNDDDSPTYGQTIPFPYSGGMVHLRNTNCKYGYYEIQATYPKGQGFYPAFWLFDQKSIGNNEFIRGEIDINEIDGNMCAGNNQMGINYHYDRVKVLADGTEQTLDHWVYASGAASDLDPLSVYVGDLGTVSHTYGLFYEPNRVTFYCDQKQVTSFIVPDQYVIDFPLQVIFNLGVNRNSPPNSSTIFPANLKINYFKHMQLKFDCGVAEIISTFNPTTYNYKVKKSIKLGVNGSSNTINTSSGVHLYATDFIEIGPNTTINPNGTGDFVAYTTRCSN